MKVYKEEEPAGTVIGITFRADGGESQADLKAGVKAWIKANYPSMGWEEFADRLVVLEAGRITISMV